MGNTSSSSKVLGVRVPLEMYLDILKKAHQNKMTITDYVIQILNFDTSDIIDELQNKCRDLQQDKISMKEDILELSSLLNQTQTKAIIERGREIMAKHKK
jgi:hypothetical protein